jgi:hypothetical protein
MIWKILLKMRENAWEIEQRSQNAWDFPMRGTGVRWHQMRGSHTQCVGLGNYATMGRPDEFKLPSQGK